MLRRAIARELESGRARLPGARVMGRAWERLADPVRPVALPAGARIIGVGGATLGGSGKTPVAVALARVLLERSVATERGGSRDGGTRQRPFPVALVGHAYRARPRAARRVAPSDPVDRVGDDALAAARALPDVPVVVGPSRDAAIHFAATLAPVVVVDALLQARPHPLALSVLVLDASAPWGAGECPPAGDLRARREMLLAAADAVVADGPVDLPGRHPRFGVYRGTITGGVGRDGTVGLDALRGLRVGVVLAVARPERVLRALRSHGVDPAVVRLAADHSVPSARGEVDVWLTTAKCSTKLGDRLLGRPVLVLEHRVELPAWLARRAAGVPGLAVQAAVLESGAP